MPNNPDFILSVIRAVDRIAGHMPDAAEQYRDEEHRLMYREFSGLFKIVKDYRDVLATKLEIARVQAKVEAGKTDIKGKETRDYHVGSSDYSKNAIQPWDVWAEYGLNPWDADIMKRVIRTKDIPGEAPSLSRVVDYKKIQHICQERIDQINAGEPWYRNFKMPSWVTGDNND